MRTIADQLNAMDEAARAEALLRCCGASEWSREMAALAPFEDDAAVINHAERVWSALDRRGVLEALAAHPRIGDIESLRAKYSSTKDWASGEQSGVDGAGEGVLRRLADKNAEYESRFGHLFIICATGKSATEMLAALEARVGNDPAEEIAIAAAEQLKITLLRLRKLAE